MQLNMQNNTKLRLKFSEVETTLNIEIWIKCEKAPGMAKHPNKITTQ